MYYSILRNKLWLMKIVKMGLYLIPVYYCKCFPIVNSPPQLFWLHFVIPVEVSHLFVSLIFCEVNILVLFLSWSIVALVCFSHCALLFFVLSNRQLSLLRFVYICCSLRCDTIIFLASVVFH